MKQAMTVALTAFVAASKADAGQAEIDQLREKFHLPALVATWVSDQATTTYVSGVRKWGDAAAVARSDRFHLGSCTKAMTATVLALQIEKGLLKWDSTLESLFPKLADEMDPALKKVTVEMLTAHRSGLTGDLVHFQSGKLWKSLWDEKLDPRDGRKLVAKSLLSAEPASKPGSRHEYSNGNYIIIGAILESLGGESWEAQMKKNLFQPLGMSSCGFGVQADPKISPPNQPWPHTLKEGKPSFVVPDFSADNPPTVAPAGGVHCAIEDWARFAKLHMDGFNERPTPLLSKKSFKKLHESFPGQDYTYGGWIRVSRTWAGGPALTHAGSNTLNHANLWIAPHKNAAYLDATNIGGDAAAEAADAAIGVLLKEFGLRNSESK